MGFGVGGLGVTLTLALSHRGRGDVVFWAVLRFFTSLRSVQNDIGRGVAPFVLRTFPPQAGETLELGVGGFVEADYGVGVG